MVLLAVLALYVCVALQGKAFRSAQMSDTHVQRERSIRTYGCNLALIRPCLCANLPQASTSNAICLGIEFSCEVEDEVTFGLVRGDAYPIIF